MGTVPPPSAKWKKVDGVWTFDRDESYAALDQWRRDRDEENIFRIAALIIGTIGFLIVLGLSHIYQ